LLDSLNGPQRDAVLDFEHPLLVLAGAGSGKTRVITTKIAYALKNLGYSPYSILAVTFTNKAAREMRERVQRMCPDITLRGLEIRTFHSFGSSILRRFGEKASLPSDFTIYDDDESLQCFSAACSDTKKDELRKYLKAIAWCKDKGERPEDIDERKFLHLPGFKAKYKIYDESLLKSHAVDFADLILKTNELLGKNDDVRSYYNNRFRLILVDEYQDSNGSQFEFLNLLIGSCTQIVVVGDDDQSIYRFRGAEIEHILEFSKRHEKTRTIVLGENYRSTKNILRIADSIIKNNKVRNKKELFTNNESGSEPRLIRAFNEEDEAEKIAAILLRDKSFDSSCVLYRNNAQSLEFEKMFTACHIPYAIVGALRFFEREEVKDVIALLSLIANPYDTVSFSRMVNKPSRGIGKASLAKMLDGTGNMVESLRGAVDGGVLSGKAKGGGQAFLSAYDECSRLLDQNGSSSDFAKAVIDKFGLFNYYKSSDDEVISKTKVDNLSAFVGAYGETPTGREGLMVFLENVMLDSSLMGNKDMSDEDGVKIMTMHNAKGLEFDRVFVTGLEDELIPGQHEDADEKTVEEERRLLYVAITRARKDLYLSYAGRRLKWGMTTDETPSRYLREIPKDFYDGDLVQCNATYGRPFAFTPRQTSSWAKTGRWNAPRIENRPSWSEGIKLPKVKERPRAENPEAYAMGDRIMSPDYGTGTVIHVEDRNGSTVVRIKYDDGRTSLYNVKYSNIRKL